MPFPPPAAWRFRGCMRTRARQGCECHFRLHWLTSLLGQMYKETTWAGVSHSCLYPVWCYHVSGVLWTGSILKASALIYPTISLPLEAYWSELFLWLCILTRGFFLSFHILWNISFRKFWTISFYGGRLPDWFRLIQFIPGCLGCCRPYQPITWLCPVHIGFTRWDYRYNMYI